MGVCSYLVASRLVADPKRPWRRRRRRDAGESALGAWVVCGDPAVEVDHVIERLHGGTNEPRYLRALCKPCHPARRVKLSAARAIFRIYGAPIRPELERAAADPASGERLRGDLTRR